MVRATVDDIFFNQSTNEAIRDALPEIVITAFGLVTHLGDGAALIVFATLLYWFGADSRRERRALVIAIGLGALAISAGMKGIFLRPRPELAGGYGGYSFPSAHAMGAAAFYGALAAVSDTGSRRQRYVAAGTIITLIAFSRLVIGVHYLGDVVVGVLIGLAFVAVLVRGETSEPGFVFVLSAVIAIAAYVLGSREFTTLTIGSAIGATIVWYLIADYSPQPRGAAILVLGVLCVPFLIALRLFFGTGLIPGNPILETVGYGLATGAILAVPVVAERLNHWPLVEWLQARLPFTGRTIDQDQLVKPSND